MFYDKYAQLCKQRGISRSAAAVEAGLSKSLVTKWKTNKVEVPSPDVLKKLSVYFNLPVSELLGEDMRTALQNEKTPGTGEGAEALKDAGYYRLNDENKKLIDQMIAQLVKAQSGD